MPDTLKNYPGYALRRAASAMMTEFSARLAPLDLRFADVSAMILIDTNAGLTASQLGRMLDIQRANMVPLLNRLEAAGLVDRVPLDRKSFAIVLTAAGLAQLDPLDRLIADFESGLLAKVPPQHRDHLLPALAALWR